MFVDALMLLADAQAFTATAYSTNTIDLGAATREIGVGEALELVVTVDVAGDRTTGDETYEVQIVQSANANLSSHDVLVSRAIPVADLAAGKVIRVPLPAGSVTKRYIGARLVLAGTTPTITVTAFIQPAAMASLAVPQSYAKGYTVS